MGCSIPRKGCLYDSVRSNHSAIYPKNKLAVDPLTDEQIQPASVDLRLGTHYLKMNEFVNGVMTLEEEMVYEEFESEEVVIPPQSFYWQQRSKKFACRTM